MCATCAWSRVDVHEMGVREAIQYADMMDGGPAWAMWHDGCERRGNARTVA